MQNNDKFLEGNAFIPSIDNIEVSKDVKKSTLDTNEELPIIDQSVVNNLNIFPSGDKILLKPYAKNPFDGLYVDESGIVTQLSEHRTRKNPDTGEYDDEVNFVMAAEVMEIGDKVNCNVKVGDVVFYTKPSQIPIPFLKLGYVVITESRILAIVREDGK